MQTTVKTDISLRGIGLHSGCAVTLRLLPAPAGTGICFKRTDRIEGDPVIPARWDLVERTPLCTKLVNADGVSVSTVEHLMAALAGCGVHNAVVEISGGEVPILDGSSEPFVAAILKSGLRQLQAPIRAIEVLKTVQVRKERAWARLDPAANLSIAFEIDFPDAAIGHQARTLNMANGAFVRELCNSRTFCRQADVDAMRAVGKGLGGSLSNAVVVEGAEVLNPDGMRHPDEPVRHKMLDALGDLALANGALLGAYKGYRAGHSLTNTLLRALFADPSAYRIVSLDAGKAGLLPGVGVSFDDLRHVA